MNVTESAPVTEASPSRWSAGLAGVRAFRVVLWLLVIAGPVMAAWAAAQVAAANRYLEARLEVEAAPPVVSTASVEGFAELAVADFLSHGHDSSGDYENEASVRPDVRTVSVGAEAVAPGYSAVTVAAIHPTVGVTFYTIGISSSEAGWAAVSKPSLIPPPPTSPAPSLAAPPSGGIDDAAGLDEAVDGFLSALLTGDGDISRYTAPGSNLTAVTPPPFDSVEMTAAGSIRWSEGARLVTADVEGRSGDSAAQSLTYSVVLADQNGRWEVVELLAAPPLEGSPMSENQEERSTR